MNSLYQRTDRLEALLGHIIGEETGFLVTLTGRQARLDHPDARQNELAGIQQRSFRYPDDADEAADYLIAESARGRDTYFGVHLFRKRGNRLAANATPTVRCLWLDEDEGHFPEIGPEPTAFVASSSTRRHLYWRLTRAVSVEWAVEMNRRLATWAAGDIGKAGLASVLRPPGTMNYKRHPQVDRVTLRLAEVDAWEPEVLDQAVPELPEPTTPIGAAGPYDGPELELAEFLSGVEVIGEVQDGLGAKVAIVCPWVSTHSGGDRTGTYVGQRADGGLWFYCHHEHCQGRTWRDFRAAVPRLRSVRVTRRAGDASKAKRVVLTRDN